MNAEPTLSVSPDEQRRLLQREQVALAVQQIRKVPLLHFLTDVGSTAIAWMAGARASALIWLLLMTIVQVGRSRFVVAQHARQVWSASRMLRFLTVSMALQGLLHSAIIVIIFMQHHVLAQYAITTIMLGVSAGAIAPSAGHLPIFLWWALGFGMVMGGCWLSEHTLLGMLLAVLPANLLGLFAMYVRDQGRTMLKMVGLTESLRIERDRAERERQRAEAESQRAHAANEARTRFFAAASHDLRQPLHALGINAATVQVLAQQSGDATLGQVSAVIRRALSECRGLLDSLLEISELDAGAVRAERQVVDLQALLQRVRDDCLPLAQDKGLSLVVSAKGDADAAPHAWTDAGLLARMLRNLVGNAVKFTTEGEVRLALRRVEADGQSWWLVSVSDTGPGIAEADLDKIFEEFYQVGNPERDRSRGLGLGLAIVRRLASLVDAEVGVHSQRGHGTTFTLRLPLAEPAPARTWRAADEVAMRWDSPAPRLQPSRVLIVDDEPEVRASLTTFLNVMGMDVQAVATPDAALAGIREGWHPQVLLLDLRLQGGASGLDALQVLREAGCAAPAILITGDTAPARIQLAQATGLPVLFKPVDGQHLLDALHQVLAAPVDGALTEPLPRS